MLLSARILKDVASVNIFGYSLNAEWTEGDTVTLYFQLLDSSQDVKADPPGRRYMPAAGATLEVTIGGIDNDKIVVRSATQPYAQDPSIWSVSILATDQLKGSFDLKLRLVEGVKTTRGVLRSAVRVFGQNESFC